MDSLVRGRSEGDPWSLLGCSVDLARPGDAPSSGKLHVGHHRLGGCMGVGVSRVGVWRILGAAPEEAASPPEAPSPGWWEPWQDPWSQHGIGGGAVEGSLDRGPRGSVMSAWIASPHPASPLLPQATAETVYDILSPAEPISRSLQDKRSVRRQRKGQQPADLREGVVKAYDTVREVMRSSPVPITPHPLSTQTPALTAHLHRASWTRLRPSVRWHLGVTSRRG